MKRDYTIFGSFKYAFQGISDAIKREPNLIVHVATGLLACLLAAALRFSTIEWAILVLTIAMVLILEFINTTLEALTDIVSPKIREEARIAKDVAAGCVLLAATTAIIIGALLFIPKILQILS